MHCYILKLIQFLPAITSDGFFLFCFDSRVTISRANIFTHHRLPSQYSAICSISGRFQSLGVFIFALPAESHSLERLVFLVLSCLCIVEMPLGRDAVFQSNLRVFTVG